MSDVSGALAPDDARRAHHAPGSLRAFNDTAVLTAADVHVARRLGRLADVDDDAVLLAVALAVRAPRLGHVCTDLATAKGSTVADVDVPVDVQALPWPELDDWLARVAASPLVAGGRVGDALDTNVRPLRLVGTRLYLDRYWRQERQIATDLQSRSRAAVDDVDHDVLRAGLARLFERQPDDLQQLASAVAVLRRFTVVAGGPGTGKTSTVARILALLDEQARATGAALPRVALAAPTGKAAARLQEAVHSEAARLDTGDDTRAQLLALNGSTLHRLLGWRPDSHSRFRHDRGNPLPHDVVVVDEASMVSLSLMAKLVESVRVDARLILVGDPDQLASVEAGAVLGDVIGPAARELHMRGTWRDELASLTGRAVPATDPPTATGDPPAGTGIGDGIVVLRTVHRYGGAIAELASAIQCGDDDAAMAVLRSGADDVEWIEGDLAEPGAVAKLDSVRRQLVAAGREVHTSAEDGNARGALDHLGAMRILCAHRRGPYGVSTWMGHVEGWLARSIEGYGVGRWYVGRPLLVTENDYGLGLYNGDTGVIIERRPGEITAAFDRRGELLEVRPSRLAAVETVHAMTVHKSQGSQFATVAVLLPDASSPILSRELLYTAVTRAQQHLIIAGGEAAIRAAVRHPIARASGLRDALWQDTDPGPEGELRADAEGTRNEPATLFG